MTSTKEMTARDAVLTLACTPREELLELYEKNPELIRIAYEQLAHVTSIVPSFWKKPGSDDPIQ